MRRIVVTEEKPAVIMTGIQPEFEREGIVIDGGEIIIIRKGWIKLGINYRTVEQPEGSVTVLYPGDIVMVEDHSDDAELEYLIFLNAIVQEALSGLPDVHLKAVQQVRCISSAIVRKVADAFLAIISSSMGILTPKDFHSLMIMQIRSFFTLWQAALIAKGYDVDSYRSHQDELFARFLRLLSEHVQTSRAAAFYADKLNITTKYLTFIVRKHAQRSTKTAIDEYAILKLRQQLLANDTPVNELAWQWHFATPSHFCEYFKRLSGSTPQAFRTNHSYRNSAASEKTT